jgi:hypothetical protein
MAATEATAKQRFRLLSYSFIRPAAPAPAAWRSFAAMRRASSWVSRLVAERRFKIN